MFDNEDLGFVCGRVLSVVYRRAGGTSHVLVDLSEIQSETGFSNTFMEQAVTSLMSWRYIRRVAVRGKRDLPWSVAITDKGLDRVKGVDRLMRRSDRSLQAAASEHASVRALAAEHPPAPTTMINIYGDMVGSPVQSGSPGAIQRHKVGNITTETKTDSQIRAFLAAYDAKVAELRQEQTPKVLAEVAPRVSRVRKEIEKPGSDRRLVKDTLASIRSVLENGTGGVVTAGLLLLLSQIHW